MKTACLKATNQAQLPQTESKFLNVKNQVTTSRKIGQVVRLIYLTKGVPSLSLKTPQTFQIST